MKYALCWSALLSLIASPAMANPRCFRCAVPVAVPVKVRTIIKREVVAVQTPIVIVPTYSATFLPPPPVVIQQGSTNIVPQSVNYAQQQSSYTIAAGTAVQAQAAVAAPVVSTCIPAATADKLAMVLDKIHNRLCALEGDNGTGSGPMDNGNGGAVPPPPPPPGNGAPAPGKPLGKDSDLVFPPLPRPGEISVYPKSWNGCAVCHTGPQAEKGFAMFEGPGKLAKLTDRQWRMILLKVGTGQMPPKGNAKGVPDLTQKDVDETFDYAATQK